MRLDVSKVGVMALGSHEERHGAALPLDTDTKLASHVAQDAAKRAGAKFICVLGSSYELPGIDTGKHQPLEKVIEDLRTALQDAKSLSGVKAVVLVNGHGGNNPLRERLPALSAELGIQLVFNNTLIDLEGPHAATGELSMGAAVGITNSSKIADHADFARHPEVGFVGLREVRQRYDWAERQAQEVEKLGVRADKLLGEKLLECAIIDVINDIHEL